MEHPSRWLMNEKTGLVFVLIPGGTFRMGAMKENPAGDNDDPEAEPDESPIRPVALSPFLLSKYEMTQGQWRRFSGQSPSNYGPGTNFGGKATTLAHPVEQVNWGNCTLVLGRLGFALPTEAQWEYACRGGTSEPWWSGVERERLAQVANLADAFCRRNGGPATRPYEVWNEGYTVHAPVGSYRANAFGLHDEHGNVWEWCRDWKGNYDVDLRPGDGLRNPVGARSRVSRGGSFLSTAAGARSAYRFSFQPGTRGGNLGVRPLHPITSR